jgi:hypothetical protein
MIVLLYKRSRTVSAPAPEAQRKRRATEDLWVAYELRGRGGHDAILVFRCITTNRTAGDEEPNPVLDRVKALASLDPAREGFGLDTVCAQG